VVRQEDGVEKMLRECIYHDPEPCGKALRLTGDALESNEEVLEILKKLGLLGKLRVIGELWSKWRE